MVCIRNPGDDCEENMPYAGVRKLLVKMNECPPYIAAFVTTLELNKFESVHQKYDKPRILIRENDDYGISVSVQLNSLYPHLRNSLEQVLNSPNGVIGMKARHIMGRIESDPTTLPKLEVMLAMAQIETILAADLPLLKDFKTPPLLQVRYDPDGLPITYKINEHAVDVTKLPDGFELNFKKSKQ